MALLDDILSELSSLSLAELQKEWRRRWKTKPPALCTSLLARAIGYRLQEQRYGGLPSAITREIAQMTGRLQRQGKVTIMPSVTLKPGTRLAREWKGRTHHVLVMKAGFQFEGRRFGSLSEIAQSITGTHWSGPRFFGLQARPAPFVIVKANRHG